MATFNTAFGSMPTPRDQMGFSTSTKQAPGVDSWDILMERRKAEERERLQQQANQFQATAGTGTPQIPAGWQTPAQPAQPAQPAAEGAAQPAKPAQPAQPQPTFAQMQAQGIARPAPPGRQANPAQGVLPEQASDQARESLETRLQRQLGGRPKEPEAERPPEVFIPEQPATEAMAPALPQMDAFLPQLMNVLGQPVAPMPAPAQTAPAPAPAPAEAEVAAAEVPEAEVTAEPTAAPAVEPTAQPTAAGFGATDEELQSQLQEVLGYEQQAARDSEIASVQSQIADAEQSLKVPDEMMRNGWRYNYDTGRWVSEDGKSSVSGLPPEQMRAEATANLTSLQGQLATILSGGGAPTTTIGGAPIPEAQATTQALTPQQAQLQTQLQQQLGMAPTSMPDGGFAFSSNVNDLQQRLLNQLYQMEQAPSRFESEAFKASRDAARANLEAEYGAERSKLEEEMARRGLSASSIASGRYGDLAGQQARALATMEADLLKEAAMMEAQDKALLLQTYQGLLSNMTETERSRFELNLKSYEVQNSLRLRAEELQQEARLRGRAMDIEEAMNLAQIDLAKQELTLKRDMFTADQEYRMQQLAISRDELALKREQMKKQDELGWAQLTEEQRNNKAIEKIQEDRLKLDEDELVEKRRQYDEDLVFRNSELTWKKSVTTQEQANAAVRLGLDVSATTADILVKVLPIISEMTDEQALSFLAGLGIKTLTAADIKNMRLPAQPKPGPTDVTDRSGGSSDAGLDGSTLV